MSFTPLFFFMKKTIFFVLLFVSIATKAYSLGCSASNGWCYYVYYSVSSKSSGTNYRSMTEVPVFSDCGMTKTSATGSEMVYSYSVSIQRYVWNSVVGYWSAYGNWGATMAEDVLPGFVAALQAAGASTSSPTVAYPSGPPADFCQEPACDLSDSDSDGVCNACDQVPNAPDLDDCLLTESVDKNTGQLVAVTINRQCDGQTHEYWQSENYNPLTARTIANIGASADKIGKQDCQAGLPAGQCCAYGPGSPGETYTASLSPQPSIPATTEEIINSLLDLPSLDDIPDKCANHNATCKQYCEDKLGVAMSYCRDGDNGKKVSDCKCNNDFAYSMASPDESTQEKVDQVDQAINKDSNANGVPDYADAGTQNKADTDSDGIHDQADVDQTGGIDANGDGIDDKATAEAHANAVASSGLSEADSRNLDAIEQSTAQTASGVEGVKNAMDQVVSKADDLLEAADSALAESQAIRDHLDTFTEENTGSLSTIEQTLNDGPFSGIAEGDIPDDPTTEENFDVDSFVQEFSFAFPDEMKDLIEDSKIETTSSDSCIRGTVMGQQIEFCFNQFHSIFVAMGVLFQGLCVFRAFGIVVGGFGR